MVRDFMKLLQVKWDERKFVCVGLDSDAGKLPILYLGLKEPEERLLKAQHAYIEFRKALQKGCKATPLKVWQKKLLAKAQLAFNKRIVDATKDIVCAYKPNVAFYEALGDAGWKTLEQTILYINKVAPTVPVILDFKRGDIDNTNLGYVLAAYLADAITVHPYLGWKAMKPFLDQAHKGVFVLAKTSNEGADEFQDLAVHQGVYHDDSGEAKYGPLYQRVARNVAGRWNYSRNCGVVAGATFPEDVAMVRKIVGDDLPILAPGIGSQGGDHEATILAAVNRRGDGFLLNDSRKAIFAGSGSDFPDATRARVVGLNKINETVLAVA